MNVFDISSILVTLSALLMYINFKYIKLPTTIGLMGLSLILSSIVFVSGYINPSIISYSISLIDSIDFNKTLMGGMLSFLLFAGALHVDINDLLEQKILIAILATLGVIFSTIGFFPRFSWFRILLNRGFFPTIQIVLKTTGWTPLVMICL